MGDIFYFGGLGRGVLGGFAAGWFQSQYSYTHGSAAGAAELHRGCFFIAPLRG